MKRVENIIIDVKNYEYHEIKLKQMDTTQLVFKMYDNSNEMDLTGTQARIIFTKPNQKIVIQSAIVNEDNKSITANLKEDCVRSYGSGKVEVEILKDNEVLSSFQLSVRIEKTNKENLASSDTPNYFEELEDSLGNFKKESSKLLNDIETAEKTRTSNENERILAEETRTSNENIRTSKEEERVEAEKGRVEAEKLRAQAETERTTEIESIKTKNTEQDEKISALESDNNTNKTDISNIKQEQTTQNETIESLKSKDTEHDTKLTELEDKDTELENKIIELTDKAGNKLKLEIDPVNYIMTLELLNEKEETLDTQTIDFPLESVVVNGRYEEGNIILTLQNETEITIPIGDIVNGLINQETFDQAIEKINTEINGIKERLDTIEEEQVTQNDKLQSLENKDTELTENIETLQKEATTLKEETERLKEDINSLATGQAEGENITIEDGTGARFKKLEISGNSWQETDDTKPSPDNPSEIRNCGENGSINIGVCNENLYDVNDRYIFGDGVTVDEDGWITIDYDNTNGSRVIYQYAYTNLSNKLKPSTQYLIVMEVKDVKTYGEDDTKVPTMEIFNGLAINCQMKDASYMNLNYISPNTKIFKTGTTRDSFEKCNTMLRTQIPFRYRGESFNNIQTISPRRHLNNRRYIQIQTTFRK